MRHFLAGLLLALVPGLAQLQPIMPAAPQPGAVSADPGEQAERSRIEHSRRQADALFATREAECYGRFAVTDCLLAARAQRRETLAELRRQENVLNGAQRRRKAADELLRVEKKADANAPR